MAERGIRIRPRHRTFGGDRGLSLQLSTRSAEKRLTTCTKRCTLPNMRQKANSAKGVRLPDELWETIDREAQALQMSRNELLGRRLRACFSHDIGNRKTAESSQETAEVA